MITMWPLDDGVLALPRLIGMVLTTWSALVTVVVWVASSVVIRIFSPMVALIVTSLAP